MELCRDTVFCLLCVFCILFSPHPLNFLFRTVLISTKSSTKVCTSTPLLACLLVFEFRPMPLINVYFMNMYIKGML